MAAIRVYLLTCRRPLLLRRALRSLLAQTFTDWVCELHNDAPEDGAPAEVMAELAPGDPRFSYHRHDPCWGPVESFNHCFRGGPEPYAALLEDDNWWEPALLATLHSELEGRPGVNLAWANMRLWRENGDSTWTDTGGTVWPPGATPRLFEWPVLLQAFDGLHSNGAMVFRCAGAARCAVPSGTPFAIIEPSRERALAGGLLLVPQVLANFALTRRTTRSQARALWAEGQLMLAASFFESVPLAPAAWDALIRECRGPMLGRRNTLVLVALAGVRRREILSRLTPADLARFSYSFAGSLGANLRALRFRRTHSEFWAWLRAQTEARTQEARQSGWTALGEGSLLCKWAAGEPR